MVSVLTLTLTASVAAHVTVKPSEVVTAGYQTFTVSVPNEKDIPTTSVRLDIPDSISSVTPTQKSGWEITVTNDNERITSVTWSGGSIGEGFRDEFTFSTRVPDEATELQWKAYQTYADGTVVSWDKASEGGHGETGDNSGPFSVTKVVTESSADASAKQTAESAAQAEKTANRALYVAIAGIVVGLIGIAIATRKK